jgi:glutaredoxin
LLEIDFGGRILRVADDALEVYDADSTTWLRYTPGIDALTVSSALNFLSSSPGAVSVPVECYLPLDLAAEDAAGHRFEGCPATISLWDDGDDYAARTVLASGLVTGAEFGEEGESVAFSVERPASVSAALAIPANQRVDGVTWPDFITNIDVTELGIPYPRVYGRPGWISASSWVTGSQLAWFAYSTPGGAGSHPPVGADFVAVIAGHRIDMSYIQVNYDARIAGEQFAVYHTFDGRGQEVAVISKWANYPTNDANTVVDGAGQTIRGIMYAGPSPVIGAPVAAFVGWTSPVSTDTGGLSPVAGDVIMDQLRLAGERVDYARFQAAAALLTGYRFDCVIDDGAAKAIDWLQSNIYPLLPVSIESGEDGSYPIVWRYDATTSDATARLDADTDARITRAGKAKDDSSEVANAFSIQYRYSLRTGSYTETATRDASTCPYCAESERRYGRIEKAITTVVVYDEATAQSVLAWQARAFTSPRRRVPYLVPRSYGLTKGQIVTLTDSRVAYADRLCLVADVQVDGSGIDGVELLFIPDPLRD